MGSICLMMCFVARHEVDEFAEGESAQVIRLDNSVQFGVFVFQAHHAAAGEDNLQIRVLVVALTQFGTPVGLLEHLVDEQHATAFLAELAGKVGNAVPLEVEVVHVDVQALAVVQTESLLGILQQESRLAHATGSLDAYHAVVPVDFVHQQATYRGIDVFYQVAMRSKKSFHIVGYCFQ